MRSGDWRHRDVSLRKARGWHVAPRLVQHRFVLDARTDNHRRIYPLPLICGQRDLIAFRDSRAGRSWVKLAA